MQAILNRQIILKKLPSGVAFAIFDSPGKSNHLTQSVVSEFTDLLKEVENDASIKALGILSNKPDFILGADLKEILQFNSKEDAYKLSTTGQKLFNQLASLSKPTLAGINGACLGGGLELVLCCHKRIATTNSNTILGLPEVKLGLLPGLGGTQRLPRLIPIKEALELILLAEPISVQKGLAIGLIDHLVDEKELESSLEEAALQMLKDGNLKTSITKTSTSNSKQGTTIATFRRSVRMRTKGRYPAQTKALDVVETGLTEGMERGLTEEALAFSELAVSDISHNLIALFFGTEIARHSAVSLANKDGITKAKTIGVLGGGLMGMGLARLAALSGFRVLFRPLRRETAEKSFESLVDSVQKSAERNRLEGITSPPENITLVTDDSLFRQADIIFEAGPENTPKKVEIFKSLQNFVKPDAVLATITSSLSIADMKEQIQSEAPLIGVHFFYPVEKMPLVEIAAQPSTSRAALGKVSGFVAELGKIPVYVKDSPCFLVNRLLCCYLLEAARLAESGVALDWLESAALDFGMPMGPLALLDEVGLDVAVRVAETLNLKFGERATLPAVLTKVKHSGFIGKKAGMGIYQWDEAGARKGFNPELISLLELNTSNTPASSEELTQLARRMILPMVDEAARCLEEKVVRRAREIDLATILGIGFPPFRGGLLKYADSLGSNTVVAELEHIYAQTTPLRIVSETLKRQAISNGKFYPASIVSD